VFGRHPTGRLRQMVISKNDSGLKPRIGRPDTAAAANTATTDVRPSSARYTSFRCRIGGELVQNQGCTDPEKECSHREPTRAAVDGQRDGGQPGNQYQHDANHHVVHMHRAMADIAWLPPSGRGVAVRPPPDIADDGARHQKCQTECDQTQRQRQPPWRDLNGPVEVEHAENLPPTGLAVPGYHPTRRSSPIRWGST
jgi:hypothetical protein